MKLREIGLLREEALLEQSPHLNLVYEHDLLRPESHQDTLGRVFDYLGLPSVPVRTTLVRTRSSSLRDFVYNYEEVESAVIDMGYGRFLDDSRYD